MKEVFLTVATSLIVAIVLFGCKMSPEEKAKVLVKESLYNSLHDYSSYEPVSYGTLDSNYSSLEDDEGFMLYKKYHDSLSDEVAKITEKLEQIGDINSAYEAEEVRTLIEKSKPLIEVGMNMSLVIDSAKNAFQSEFSGWKMRHTYRANTLAGHLSIHHTVFYFNDSITSVVKTKDLTE